MLTSDLRILGRDVITQKEVEACLHDLDDTHKIITDALALGNYYNAVSHTDLVYRVLRHFEGERDRIPFGEKISSTCFTRSTPAPAGWDSMALIIASK